MSNSEYLVKSKRMLREEWLNALDEPPGKRMLLTRMILSKKLDNWEIGAKAVSLQGFNTAVPETDKSEQEALIEEVRNEYVGWEPPVRANNDE